MSGALLSTNEARTQVRAEQSHTERVPMFGTESSILAANTDSAVHHPPGPSCYQAVIEFLEWRPVSVLDHLSS